VHFEFRARSFFQSLSHSHPPFRLFSFVTCYFSSSFVSCRFALPAFSFRSAMSRLLRASVETQMAHSQTHKLTSRQTRKRTHDTDEAHSKTNARELPVLPTGLRMQASWQPWSTADASACTLRKVGGRTEDIYICACICTASASPNLARTFLRYMCSKTKQNGLTWNTFVGLSYIFGKSFVFLPFLLGDFSV